MTRLEQLKVEQKALDEFVLIPAQMKQMLLVFYAREIDTIEKYGAENPELEN